MSDSRIPALNFIPTLNFGRLDSLTHCACMVLNFPTCRCMTSEVLELVASDEQRFFVHQAILTSQSTFEITSERTINLRSWDSNTVARLVEFLYCRNYDYPDPAPLGPRVEHSLSEPLPPAQGGSEVTDHRRPLTPLADCSGSSLPLDEPPRTDAQRLHPFHPPDYDLGGMLLVHAKVYALASSKSIIPLQTLSLRRLLLVLLRLHPLQPKSHTLKNIVDFASFVYASNISVNIDYLTGSEEPLRKLTSQFIALNFVAFQSEQRAVELIAEGGDLVVDVMAKVCRRLSDPVGVSWPGGHSEKEVRYISGIKVFTSLEQTARIDRRTPNRYARLCATSPHLPIMSRRSLAWTAI